MDISDNELVTLMLCSELALHGELKPYSDAAYAAFAKALFLSGKQPSDLFKMTEGQIQEICNAHAPLFTRIKRNDFAQCIPQLIKRHQQIFFELATLEKEGIRVVTRANKQHYPAIIRQKLIAAGIPLPAVIYYSGDLSLLDSSKILAIVGSRDLERDKDAVKFTGDVVRMAVAGGYAISSGGAKGVDGIAQDTALANGGRCIITVAENLSKKIQQVDIRHAIVDRRCVFLSLVHPHQRFLTYNAMARNKLIYAAAKYAIVVSCEIQTKIINEQEAIDNNKGGTWTGANECAKKNLSELIVRCCPENMPKGNLELINTLACRRISAQDLALNMSFDEIIKCLPLSSAANGAYPSGS